MPTSEKDPLAAEAKGRWEDFREGFLSEKRNYSIQQFQPGDQALRRIDEV
jgi:hypothetical protein